MNLKFKTARRAVFVSALGVFEKALDQKHRSKKAKWTFNDSRLAGTFKNWAFRIGQLYKMKANAAMLNDIK